jgi:hypothetical protein
VPPAASVLASDLTRSCNLLFSVEIVWFYYLSLCVAVLAGMMLCEAVIVASPNVRGAYLAIPAVVFLNFAFSGIFVKTPTLPRWAADWLPEISLFKWTVQSQVINLFNDDDSLICVPPFYFCTYSGFLGLFGWTQTTKWNCFWVIVTNLAVYRGIVLLTLIFRTITQKGMRQFRVVEKQHADDRQY